MEDQPKPNLMEPIDPQQTYALEAFFEILKNIQDCTAILDTRTLENARPIFMNDAFKVLLASLKEDIEEPLDLTLCIQKNILPCIRSSLERAISYPSNILQSIALKTQNTQTHFLCHIIPVKKSLELIHQTVLILRPYQDNEAQSSNISRQETTLEHFVSGITHDFNNILVIINAYIDILKLKLKNHSDLEAPLEIMRNAGTKAGELVDQLMNFCNESTNTKKIFNLKDSVLEIKSILEYTLSKEAVINIETDLQDAFIEANPCEIEQILTNLCLNAQQAMPKGGSLKISLKLEAHSPYVCLSVQDQGCGIPETIKTQLFEASVTTKLQKKGHGFGLFNSASIVKKLDGFIEVDSKANSGTTFKLFFKQASTHPPKTVDHPEARLRHQARAHIVCLETNDNHLGSIIDLLGPAGYTAIPFKLYTEKPEAYTKIDLLLLGPSVENLEQETNAFECIEKLIHKNPQLKIICLSQSFENQKLLKDKYHNRLFCFPHLTHLQQILKVVPSILNIDSMRLF